MIKIPGLEQMAPAHTVFDLQTQASIGATDIPHKVPLSIPGPIEAPSMIRLADMRPHTMIVKGKMVPNAITLSKPVGVRCTDSMHPQFGNFRDQPRGFLSDLDPQVKVDCPIMARPDSAYAFLTTKLPQPR